VESHSRVSLRRFRRASALRALADWLVLAMGQAYLAEPDADGEQARTLRPLQAAAW